MQLLQKHSNWTLRTLVYFFSDNEKFLVNSYLWFGLHLQLIANLIKNLINNYIK